MVAACVLVAGSAAHAADPGSNVTTYYESGGTFTFTIPSGVVGMHVTAIGGRGAGDGGRGALVDADFEVTEGQTFSVRVARDASGFTGGYNGGGNGAEGNSQSAGGGGASDLRTGGNELADRILVAAGGGGASSGGNGGDAGQAGGSPDCDVQPALPGSLVAGGAGGAPCNGVAGHDGTLGVGGDGIQTNAALAGGAGGAGYYGGGGGAPSGGGAGGSSYYDSSARNATVSLSDASGAPYVGVTYVAAPATSEPTPTDRPVVSESTEPTVQSTTTSKPELAATGSETRWGTLTGVAFLLTGAGLVLGRRARRRLD